MEEDKRIKEMKQTVDDIIGVMGVAVGTTVVKNCNRDLINMEQRADALQASTHFEKCNEKKPKKENRKIRKLCSIM